MEKKKRSQKQVTFPFFFLFVFAQKASFKTGSSYGQGLLSPRAGNALFQDVVRESQELRYCIVLECYTGFIAWLNYMWFPFSEFGVGPTVHGEWKGACWFKKLVSPPVHLRVVSSIAITVVEISKSPCRHRVLDYEQPSKNWILKWHTQNWGGKL